MRLVLGLGAACGAALACGDPDISTPSGFCEAVCDRSQACGDPGSRRTCRDDCEAGFVGLWVDDFACADSIAAFGDCLVAASCDDLLDVDSGICLQEDLIVSAVCIESPVQTLEVRAGETVVAPGVTTPQAFFVDAPSASLLTVRTFGDFGTGTCDIDTTLTVLDEAGTVIAFNDDIDRSSELFCSEVTISMVTGLEVVVSEFDDANISVDVEFSAQ
ncbi:MAG: hypothetical protein ACFB9M_04825 [Myxococcota bacterium]